MFTNTSHALLAQLQVNSAKVCFHPGWNWRLKRWKFVARALLHPRLTRNWFEFLDQPGLRPLVEERPRLLAKLQRPYLARHFGPARRLGLLRSHYSFLLPRIHPEALRAIGSPAGWTLASLDFESTGPVTIRLLYTDKYEKEGDLSVAIYARKEQRVVTVATFSIIQLGDHPHEILIGGLQGSPEEDQKDLIRDVTKELWGLRPKAIAFWVLQVIAEAWDIGRIRGVGDALHVYTHYQERRHIAASYDAYWLETEGTKDSSGFFVLPPRFTPRPLEEIRSNKRGQYRKRYELLGNLALEIRRNLLALGHWTRGA
jgi:uncharacterized protein